MRDRGRHQNDIAGIEREKFRDRLNFRVDGVVAVQYPFRPTGRTRRVHDQFDRVRVYRRAAQALRLSFCEQRLERRRLTIGRATHGDDVFKIGKLRPMTGDHVRVIEIPETGRDEHGFAARIAQDVENFCIAVNRDDRIADQTQHRARQVDHDCLGPVRQLETDHIPGFQAAFLQRTGQRAGLSMDFCNG